MEDLSFGVMRWKGDGKGWRMDGVDGRVFGLLFLGYLLVSGPGVFLSVDSPVFYNYVNEIVFTMTFFFMRGAELLHVVVCLFL